MDISHIGHSIISTPCNKQLHLNNILRSPHAHKSLISAHKLACDNNAFLEIHPDSFFVKEQGTRRTILRGRCRDGLYPLSSKQAFGINKPSTTRWHSRLGHPSYEIVQRVLSQNKLPSSKDDSANFVCDACQKGKSHQLPYPKSSSVSSAPLELIFSDVWGPACASVGGNKYYVTFVDDYSKFTWIYLLKNKSDVFSRFNDFQNHVERLFDKKILALQSDWGGEYQKLSSFFQRVGIEHHVSCPHAHQQNGSAERKHRHIVEVGLTLLAHAHMPLKYWDEAFLTATFLINRIPSRVINFTTPLERLFKRKPDYSFLRTFGCACWPNLRPYNSHKLSF